MVVTNQTTSDIYFGPLHLGAGVGTQLTIDDTSATSLYLTNDAVADAVNNAYASGKVTVTGAAAPFPRPTGKPHLLHGFGNPEGLVFAPQGSVYMRQDGGLSNGGVLYLKTTGVTLNTGWVDIPTASGATASLPTGTLVAYAAAAAPTGWLLCDGSAVSRSTYSTLFGVIGTTYGSGDGSSTFNLPDLRGRAPYGLSSGSTNGMGVLGNSDGVSATSRGASHHHTYLYEYDDGGGTGGSWWTRKPATLHQVPTPSTSGGAPLDAPSYLVVNHIVKT